VKSSSRANPKEVGAQVRAYLAAQPPKTRAELKKLRAAIRAAAPGAVEVFSYGIPGFRLEGQPLVWYAGWTQHMSLYPIGEAIRREHAADVERYKFAKGTLQFPLDDPPSSTLVKRLVKSRIGQIRRKERV
jgi:uncharacterized protein YdhG (YjbR/CyaY superfamily)